MTRRYFVEGWRGLGCVGFRTVARPTTVATTATHYTVDLKAERVYVRLAPPDGGMLAHYENGRWVRVDDPALARVLLEGEAEVTPLTLKEAAEQLRVTPDTLRQQIRAGRLRARKVGRDWMVTPREVARYDRERGPQGKPEPGQE